MALLEFDEVQQARIVVFGVGGGGGTAGYQHPILSQQELQLNQRA
jgi:hypothetical protein